MDAVASSSFAKASGKPECATLTQLARDSNVPTHQLGQSLGDGEPKPGTAVFASCRCIGLLERLEKTLRSAPSVMPIPVSLTENLTTWLSSTVLQDLSPDYDLTFLSELDGVVAEVDQDLPKPQRIASESSRDDRRLDVEDQFQPFVRRLL